MTNATGGHSAPFKLGFSGSREWPPRRDQFELGQHFRAQIAIENIISIVLGHHPNIEIHVGDADGVDTWVAEKAIELRIPLFVYGAHLEIHNIKIFNNGQNLLPDNVQFVMPKEANDNRNEILVDSVDMIYGVWNGSSGGTKYTLDYAKKRGVRSHLLKVTAKGIETVW